MNNSRRVSLMHKIQLVNLEKGCPEKGIRGKSLNLGLFLLRRKFLSRYLYFQTQKQLTELQDCQQFGSGAGRQVMTDKEVHVSKYAQLSDH